MKLRHTLLFTLSVLLILGLVWCFFPQRGWSLMGYTLRFPSYTEALQALHEEGEAPQEDLDTYLAKQVAGTVPDSLMNFLTSSPARIHLPNNDFHYFDTLFRALETAREDGKLYRVMYYGDSQIEMDRITSVFRQNLQDLFGGEGPGWIPAQQPISTVSVSQGASGGLTRFTMYGDSTTQRAPHRRYGPLAHFSQTEGSSTISFGRSQNSQAQPNVKTIQKVSLLIGNNSQGFSARLKCDTIAPTVQTVETAKPGITLLTWVLPVPVRRGTISLTGHAAVYGVLLDGRGGGITVDGNPLRGCSGTIFSRINKAEMEQSFALLNTRLIVLQFGGNRITFTSSSKNISDYMRQIEDQLAYFEQVAPQATLLFIGPSDMSRSQNGRLQTWPLLPELNDSLRTTVLRRGVAYWDMFDMMGGKNSMPQWVKHSPPLAGPDYVHFTGKGAARVGKTLAEAFRACYDYYRLSRP